MKKSNHTISVNQIVPEFVTYDRQVLDDGNIPLTPEAKSELGGHLCTTTEGEEIFVLDPVTGEYQKYIYIPSEIEEPEEPITTNLEQTIALDNTAGAGFPAQETISLVDQRTSNTREDNSSSCHGLLELPCKKDALSKKQSPHHIPSTKGEKSKTIFNRHQKIKFDAKNVHSSSSKLVSQAIPSQEITSIDWEEGDEDKIKPHLIECNKCSGECFASDVFDQHCLQHYVKEKQKVTYTTSVNGKKCEICNQVYKKKDYLTHLKKDHSNVLLRCPLCPQTYHSPELLNVHYTHFHLERGTKVSSESDSSANNKTCQLVDDIHLTKALLEAG